MAEDSYSIAIYGATGAMGREAIIALEGEGLPVSRLVPVGGVKSAGTTATWGGREVPLASPAALDINDLDLAVLAGPGALCARERPRLVAAGVLAVDLSSAAARDLDLPLVWPGLSDEALESHPGAFALPCGLASTGAPVAAALAAAGAPAALDITALVGATQAGREGQEALSAQTMGLLGHRVVEGGPFGAALAFNLVAESAEADAASDPLAEEAAAGLRRLVPALADVPVRVTVIQAPVFTGVGLAMTWRFAGPAPTLTQVAEALDARADVVVAPGRVTTRDAMELDQVLVGAVRQDPDGTVRCFVAGDALHRTGQALASIMSRVIAEDLW